MTADDWGALAIDAGISGSINFAIFGIIPALVRRRRIRRQVREHVQERDPNNYARQSSIVSILLGAIAMTAVIGPIANSRSSESSSLHSSSNCARAGEKEQCITLREISSTEWSVMVTITYDTPSSIFDGYVKRMTWSGVIDCGPQTRVNDIRAYDENSNQLYISPENREQVRLGLLDNAMQAMRNKSC